MFIGREEELDHLHTLQRKSTASLVVITGRRRIGKSTLLQQYGRSFQKVFQLVGIAPHKGLTNQDQLDHFANQIALQSGLPGLSFKNWLEAFTTLSKLSENQSSLVFLDEISWMAGQDPTFVGVLKVAWDTLFKNNPKLVLALCGSVSSWIEDNILNDTDFYGRISWSHQLQELPLHLLKNFWGKRCSSISAKEKMDIILITGGVPKYLEEIIPHQTATQNIGRLCFQKEGYLFQDFNKIFNDVFNKKASYYKKIVHALIHEKLSPKELAEKLSLDFNGDFYRYLKNLEVAGFIKREYTWNLNGKESKLSKLRVSDNYVRFYLKYISPNTQKVQKGIYQFSDLESLTNWDSILGLQFENLVLNNAPIIFEKLGIPTSGILQYGPYFQTPTNRRKGCQIDLLILGKNNQLFVIEIKYKKKITRSVIDDVEKKIQHLNPSKKFSVRPYLVYMGEITSELERENYFYQMLDLSTLL